MWGRVKERSVNLSPLDDRLQRNEKVIEEISKFERNMKQRKGDLHSFQQEKKKKKNKRAVHPPLDHATLNTNLD